MSRQYLIQQHGGWLVFDNGRVSRSETRPRPQRSALAITDTEGSVSSVASLEGSPAHAVALIEKRLRADGLIDNDSKILIHKVHTVGAGYQALFTAVPLDLWQQTFAWAEAQPDHCLLVPATALLWSKLGVGQVLVCQSGRQLTVLARLKHGMVYRTTLAFSDDPGDLAMSAGALADQLAGDLQASEQAMEPLKAFWCPLLVPRPQDGEAWLDDTLREVFSARSGLAIDSVPLETVSDEDGRHYRSGAHWLVQGASPMLAANPMASRLAYIAEWALPLASAASIVFAIALGSIGARWTLSAAQATEQSRQLQAQTAETDTRIGAMARDQQIPADFPGAVAFLERISALQQTIDPVAGLADIRQAAADGVRIMRVRLELPVAAGRAAQNGAISVDRPTLRVDGVVDPARGTSGMQVPNFIERLRLAGYDPVPLDPQGGNVGAGNFFSYLLKTQVAATAGNPTP